MESPLTAGEISRIEKRAIEAKAVAPLIDALSSRIGREDALALLREINEEEAFRRGKNAAVDDERAIEALARDVATWGEGGVMEIEVIGRSPTTYHFDVTRCPYRDKYRELGLEELGVAMSCCRDEPHARGLNPNLILVRANTLMEGADRCDFRYSLDSE